MGANFFVDKSAWNPVSLGDVVHESREVVRSPVEEGLDRVVGLDHIDSESIHLRRWQPYDASTTFTKKFTKGQVLFGRRRAYLKKAALAPFDGICSGDITVLEAKQGLLPDLLPFLINNDKFFDYAIKNSAGSLSPRAKFKDLANYEFLLPPKDQQARLADLLWAGDEVIEKALMLMLEGIELKSTSLNELLLGRNLEGRKKRSPYGEIPEDWNLVPLVELRDPTDRYSFTGGPFGSNLKTSHYTQSGVRVLQLQNIGEGKFLNDYKLYTSKERADLLHSSNIYPGEIILAKMAPVARCCIIPDTEERFVMCSDGIRLKVDSDVYDPGFIFHAINNAHFRTYAESKSSGSTRGRIALSDLKQIPIPCPSKEQQISISARLNKIDSSLILIEKKVKDSSQLQKALINRIF